MKNILTNLLIVIGIAALLAAGGYSCLMYINEWNKESFPSAVSESDSKAGKHAASDAMPSSAPANDVSISSDSPNPGTVPEGLTENIVSDYEAPNTDEISVPDAGAGKSGLEDIEKEENTISDEEADKLENELSTGPLGEELNFDALFYPYYQMLNDKSKDLYRQLYANVQDKNTVFKAVRNDINRSELNNAFEALICDHASIYWLVTGYRACFRPKGNCIEIDLEYNSTNSDFEKSHNNFKNSVSEILQSVQDQSSDYEKEKAAHKAIAAKNIYNLNAPLNQSAYSAMVNGETVCAGYSRAFQYIMQQCGIPCYYCEGYAGEAHAWNIIKLEDDFYNVDLTWDDTDGDKICNYEFFNKTDADFRKDHRRTDLSVYLPACKGEKYRDLEEDLSDDAEDNSGYPSLSDYSLTENDIIRDLDSYYKDCYEKIMLNGKGSYHIYSVIEGENAFNEWNNAYKNNLISENVLSPVMEQINNANSAQINVEGIEIGQNRYILDHTVTIN